MIAADSSSLIRYFAGVSASDTDIVDWALAAHEVLLPPVVLTEVLSDPRLPAELSEAMASIPLLGLAPGYWKQAGELRRKMLAHRWKARLADTLIAAVCLQHDMPLVTNDADFGCFSRVAGLKLLP